VSIDYAARLALVQAAIQNILSGSAQSYSIDGQSVTKLDLGWLTREEERLQSKVNRLARSGGAFRQAAPR
jgi:hypothetical protein